ncbi:hypothetical protein F5144DRAFT_563049 [Chaetomium tenue]|uniref:Uncharacterized protein n=1 Tax=Chaetomium tenue TaxID=1854479 RepID=A0ACB7PJS1_9PEZI|nr:hypothetical protein F5144DRAFT_563049 [Chaetomium globosum]
MGWGFYSPGLACPTGYTAACTAEYGKRSDWEVEFTLIPGETAVGCCPEGFRCTNLNGQTCVAAAANTQLTVTTGRCSGRELVNVAPVTYPVFIDIMTTITEATSTGGRGPLATQASKQMALLAPMFQLNYQASDLAQTTTPPTAQAQPSESSNSPPISSDPFVPDDSSFSSHPGGAPEQDGLSTGAIVGIAVGAALGGILLGVLAILFIRKKRRAGAPELAESQPPEQPQYDYKYPAEMPGSNQPYRTELWTQPAELSSGSDRWSHNHHPNPR